ncbi:MAG TPA: response regulator [Opitutaceae bacterium]|jgi:CheY-like chemotaxis protein|nr:response regulator [Opitutaceae bacterium]
MARILVIEDDEKMREALVQTLLKLGHEVAQEPNGRAGLARAAHWLPELVITDLIMPEKEGLETIVELRSGNPEIRIIAMSGGGRLSNSDFLNIALKLGAQGTLAKPFTREELREAIGAALGAG